MIMSVDDHRGCFFVQRSGEGTIQWIRRWIRRSWRGNTNKPTLDLDDDKHNNNNNSCSGNSNRNDDSDNDGHP